MQPLIYHRPGTIAEALALLSRDGARVLAGGTDLVPQLREGRRKASIVVDLKRIAALTSIGEGRDGTLAVGALASATSVARHAEVHARCAALTEAARMIGSWQVQNRATIGGNIVNAAPSADAIPALLAVDAVIEIEGPKGLRREPLARLFTGPGRTTLAPGEILSSILLPGPSPRTATAYLRFTPRREMDIAVAGSGVRITLGEDGRIAAAGIALASVGPTPLAADGAAKLLVGERPSKAVFLAAGSEAARAARPISDTRGSADYRRALVEVLTARALARAAATLGIAIEVP